jgi:phenylalanyl-tRNA synthetase beta subunit
VALGIRLKQSGYSGKEDRVCDEALSAISQTLGVPFGAVTREGQKKVIEHEHEYVYHQGVAEINLTELLQKLPEPTEYASVTTGEEIVYTPFSLYPHISRDIALWVNGGTTAADVEAVLNEHAGELRVRTDLFDEFSKDGRTSFAFRLVFQSPERTLEGSEVDLLMKKINAAVDEKGWEVR